MLRIASSLAALGAVLVLTVAGSTPANATVVSYTLAADGANKWLYTFDVANNTAATPIEELTVYFSDPNVLAVAVGGSQPGDWSSAVVGQPNPALGNTLSAYGFFDTVSDSGAGVAVGADLGGFTALVTVGAGTKPAADVFAVYDASFNYAHPLDSGTTQAAGGGNTVPEPSTLGLLLIGAAALARRRARRPR